MIGAAVATVANAPNFVIALVCTALLILTVLLATLGRNLREGADARGHLKTKAQDVKDAAILPVKKHATVNTTKTGKPKKPVVINRNSAAIPKKKPAAAKKASKSRAVPANSRGDTNATKVKTKSCVPSQSQGQRHHAGRPTSAIEQAHPSTPLKPAGLDCGASSTDSNSTCTDTGRNVNFLAPQTGSRVAPDNKTSSQEMKFPANLPVRRLMRGSSGEFADVSSAEHADATTRKKKKYKKQDNNSPHRSSLWLDPLLASPRMNEIVAWKVKPGRYQFCVGQDGGVVKLPSAKILIPRGNIRNKITLNVAFCDKQRLRREEKTLIFLTPALHLWEEEKRPDPLVFEHPVEIQLASSLVVRDINNPIDVKVHWTESTVHIDWQFFVNTRFGAGPFIVFHCTKLGGYRAVTNKQPLLVPLNYVLCVKRPTDIIDPTQHNFYITLYSDTPEMRKSVNDSLTASIGRTEVVIDQQVISVCPDSEMKVRLTGADMELKEDVVCQTPGILDKNFKRNYPLCLEKREESHCYSIHEQVQITCTLTSASSGRQVTEEYFRWAKACPQERSIFNVSVQSGIGIQCNDFTNAGQGFATLAGGDNMLNLPPGLSGLPSSAQQNECSPQSSIRFSENGRDPMHVAMQSRSVPNIVSTPKSHTVPKIVGVSGLGRDCVAQNVTVASALTTGIARINQSKSGAGGVNNDEFNFESNDTMRHTQKPINTNMLSTATVCTNQSTSSTRNVENDELHFELCETERTSQVADADSVTFVRCTRRLTDEDLNDSGFVSDMLLSPTWPNRNRKDPAFN